MADVSSNCSVSSNHNCLASGENIDQIVEHLLDSMVQIASNKSQDDNYHFDKPNTSSINITRSMIPCSSSTPITGLMASEDSDIELLEEQKDQVNSNNCNQQIESITCEVALDLDMTDDTFAECLVCGSDEVLNHSFAVDDQQFNFCSKKCLEKFKCLKSLSCAQCGTDLTPNNQGYLPNFGSEGSVLCSEQCLLKYETENEPFSSCFQCKNELNKQINPLIYYWQTMEFCSTECIEKLQYAWGKKCANCNATVPQQSLGKYSVRFGNVIKQFCFGACLEAYKKTLKVCSFCQIDLSGIYTTCSSYFGPADKRRTREFCDTMCRDQYQHMINYRSSNQALGSSCKDLSTSIPCCQCQRMVEKVDCIEVTNRGQKYTLCGSFCLSAFKYTHSVNKIICESCFKFNWSPISLTILHYSGITKLFCSRKCLNMYVLRIRRIVPCLTCNVKKYNFDLVEKYDSNSGGSRLFCSLNCLEIHIKSEAILSKKELPKSRCDWCKTLSRSHYQIQLSDKSGRNFCNYGCVIAFQQHYEKIGSNLKLGPVTRHPSLSLESPVIVFPPNSSAAPIFMSQTVTLNPPNVLVTNHSSYNNNHQSQQFHRTAAQPPSNLSYNSRKSLPLQSPLSSSSSRLKTTRNSEEQFFPPFASNDTYSPPTNSSIASNSSTNSNATSTQSNSVWTPYSGMKPPYLRNSYTDPSSHSSKISPNYVNNSSSSAFNHNTKNQSSGSMEQNKLNNKECRNNCSRTTSKTLVNKMTMFRSSTKTKALSCKPIMKTRTTQTDISWEMLLCQAKQS